MKRFNIWNVLTAFTLLGAGALLLWLDNDATMLVVSLLVFLPIVLREGSIY